MSDVKVNDVEIFLSHSSLDYEKVRRIRNAFEEVGCKPIMFHLKCLEHSDDDEVFGLLKREIDAREWFVLCKSKNAYTSKWVKKEMDYVRKRKAPFVADLDSCDFDPLEFVHECWKDYKEDSLLTVVYPSSYRICAESIAQRLIDGYHIELIAYQNDFKECWAHACGNRGRILVFVYENQRLQLQPELASAERRRTLAFVLRNDWAEHKKMLVNDGVFMFPEGNEKIPLRDVELAIHCQQLFVKAATINSRSPRYKEKCRLLSDCGYAYQCAGYYGKAFACYLGARNIATINNDSDLSGFYFSAREDPVHEALVGLNPMSHLIWTDNLTVD